MLHRFNDCSALGRCGMQEFLPWRNIIKQIPHNDRCTLGCSDLGKFRLNTALNAKPGTHHLTLGFGHHFHL